MSQMPFLSLSQSVSALKETQALTQTCGLASSFLHPPPGS